MGRRLQGTLLALQNMPPLPPQASDEAIEARMDFLHDALVATGFTQSRKPGSEQVHDPEWGADIAELVFRSIPHERLDSQGNTVEVSIKLDTLRIVSDDDGAIVAWEYTED